MEPKAILPIATLASFASDLGLRVFLTEDVARFINIHV
jgi:hypothetical protein